MLIPKYYEDLKIIHENTMPKRCYYMPASKDMGTLVADRKESDRVFFLNGEWKFKYFDSIYDAQDKFFVPEYDDAAFDVVQVPGVWQNYGYDTHQYTNVRYPIPLDPPFVPQENPCGEYICEFFYEENFDAPKAYLNFEGVDSCFYVWLNGAYVGYSQVSHATSEFDITDKLVAGKNKLAVLVLKWCDGTYLEDQDKFRMSGIFRDVYILNRPKSVLYDYFITTELQKKSATVRVRANYLDMCGKDFTDTRIKLYDAEKKLVAEGGFAENKKDEEYAFVCELQVAEPMLWNAEEPYLYTIVFESEKETIVDRVGVREIYIADKIVYVNGAPVKFKGVNRHDSDPVTGFVIEREQIVRDLQMMKQHNFNAIRSSHYPNAPYFYQLCDEYGFFVIDEADNESHGTQSQYLEDASWENISKCWNERIADNPAFNEVTLDRTQLCVQRDKNRPCVVIWSMGNECAYGCTFENALAWTKKFDPTRLTHYESALYTSDKRKYDFKNIDLYSRMYPSLSEIQEYLDSNPDKPYLLVEYCHAMGNGPGDLEEYFKYIDNHAIMCGGFVWEWCDHAIYKGKAENGKDMYYYGGDHGEEIHDGNFCMDGLVYPDRRPHTGLLEYKNVYRPARVTAFNQENGELTLKNQMNFVDLKDYISVSYEVNCDGEIVYKAEIKELASIKPGQEGKVKLHLDVPQRGKCYLKIYYYLKEQNELLEAGHLLGFEEVCLENKDGRNKTVLILQDKRGKDLGTVKTESDTSQKKTGTVQVAESDRYLLISAGQFSYVYNKLNGLFEKMEHQGRKILARPMEINIWRAPTDNDRNLKLKWIAAHYNHSITRAYETTYEIKADKSVIKSRMSVASVSIQKILEIEAEWTVYGNGAVNVFMQINRNMEFPELPRFGLRLFLEKNMEQVSYYGLGPCESYVDKKHASSHGFYKAAVMDMHEDYIRPQENGSHTDCDYVEVSNGVQKITAFSEKPFSFNVSHYTQEELTNKKHNFELEESGYTVLCLDYAQNGIGSGSCGPQLLDKYKLNAEKFSFDMNICF